LSFKENVDVTIPRCSQFGGGFYKSRVLMSLLVFIGASGCFGFDQVQLREENLHIVRDQYIYYIYDSVAKTISSVDTSSRQDWVFHLLAKETRNFQCYHLTDGLLFHFPAVSARVGGIRTDSSLLLLRDGKSECLAYGRGQAFTFAISPERDFLAVLPFSAPSTEGRTNCKVMIYNIPKKEKSEVALETTVYPAILYNDFQDPNTLGFEISDIGNSLVFRYGIRDRSKAILFDGPGFPKAVFYELGLVVFVQEYRKPDGRISRYELRVRGTNANFSVSLDESATEFIEVHRTSGHTIAYYKMNSDGIQEAFERRVDGKSN